MIAIRRAMKQRPGWPTVLLHRLRCLLAVEKAPDPRSPADVGVLMQVVHRETSRFALDGHFLPAPSNPLLIDLTYPSIEHALKAAEPTAGLGHTLPPRALQRSWKGFLVRYATRLVFRVARPLSRPQSQFNQAVLYVLTAMNRDLGRHEALASSYGNRLRALEDQFSARLHRQAEQIRCLETQLASARRSA